MLFESGETKSEHVAEGHSPGQGQRTPLSSSRRRAWLWKNPLHNSFDDTDIAIADKHQLPGAPPSSLENSRRGSVCSSQSSPNRSSPRRSREARSKKESGKSRKEASREASREPSREPERPNAAQRLYRVLEEQALGEAVGRLTAAGSKAKQPANLRAPGDLSPNNRYSY